MDWVKFKMGWMLVAFDLPVTTKEERKNASQFRKFLLDDGYQMMQFSVYIRPVVSNARMETHLRRLKLEIPPDGSVRAIFITQIQWEKSYICHAKSPQKAEKMPDQMQLW